MNFKDILDSYYELNPESGTYLKSRVQETIPRIKVETAGRFTYLSGISALARFTRRPKDYVLRILKDVTGCTIDRSDGSRQRIRGMIALKSIRSFEKAYLKRVECPGCRSPQTTLEEGLISCSGCGKAFPDTL